MTPTLAIAGTAISAFGAMREGQAAEAQSSYSAKVASQNATAAEQRTHEGIRRQRRKDSAFTSKQRAAYAASGVLETGTPLTVMADSASQMELANQDKLWAGQTQAGQFRNQAAQHKSQAKSAKRAIPLNVGASLLTGANQYASSQL